MSTIPSSKRPRVYLGRTIDGHVTPSMAPSAHTLCERCLEGPRGLEGHERLFARNLGRSSVCFQCPDCFQLWTRIYVGEGNFDWARTGLVADQGISLPRSS